MASRYAGQKITKKYLPYGKHKLPQKWQPKMATKNGHKHGKQKSMVTKHNRPLKNVANIPKQIATNMATRKAWQKMPTKNE